MEDGRDPPGHGFRALAMSTLKEILRYWHEVMTGSLHHAQNDKLESAWDRADTWRSAV